MKRSFIQLEWSSSRRRRPSYPSCPFPPHLRDSFHDVPGAKDLDMEVDVLWKVPSPEVTDAQQTAWSHDLPARARAHTYVRAHAHAGEGNPKVEQGSRDQPCHRSWSAYFGAWPDEFTIPPTRVFRCSLNKALSLQQFRELKTYLTNVSPNPEKSKQKKEEEEWQDPSYEEDPYDYIVLDILVFPSVLQEQGKPMYVTALMSQWLSHLVPYVYDKETSCPVYRDPFDQNQVTKYEKAKREAEASASYGFGFDVEMSSETKPSSQDQWNLHFDPLELDMFGELGDQLQHDKTFEAWHPILSLFYQQVAVLQHVYVPLYHSTMYMRHAIYQLVCAFLRLSTSVPLDASLSSDKAPVDSAPNSPAPFGGLSRIPLTMLLFRALVNHTRLPCHRNDRRTGDYPSVQTLLILHHLLTDSTGCVARFYPQLRNGSLYGIGMWFLAVLKRLLHVVLPEHVKTYEVVSKQTADLSSRRLVSLPFSLSHWERSLLRAEDHVWFVSDILLSLGVLPPPCFLENVPFSFSGEEEVDKRLEKLVELDPDQCIQTQEDAQFVFDTWEEMAAMQQKAYVPNPDSYFSHVTGYDLRLFYDVNTSSDA